MVKAEVLIAFFISLFASKTGLQPGRCTLGERGSGQGIVKSMGPAMMGPQVLRWLADVFVRPPSIIQEWSKQL